MALLLLRVKQWGPRHGMRRAGSGPSVDLPKLCWTSAGTLMAAASANTLNQVREVWQDSQMKRTWKRPLPTGRVGRLHAVSLAAALGLGGVGLLASQVRAQQAQARVACSTQAAESLRTGSSAAEHQQPELLGAG